MLRKGEGSHAAKKNLKRMEGKQADRGRGAKLTAKNMNKNYDVSKVAALPPMAKLEVSDDKSVQQQLADIVAENNVKLIGPSIAHGHAHAHARAQWQEWSSVISCHDTQRAQKA